MVCLVPHATLSPMITSPTNDRVKRVRALQSRRVIRRKTGRFVIEGPNLIHEAVLAGAGLEEVFHTPDYTESEEGISLIQAAAQSGALITPVDPAIMQIMSDTQTPQGILGIVETPALPYPEDCSFALIIDGIADPGNMGTIMRTAAAAAVPLTIITAGTVDVTNPKVIRSAAGAHFRLPIRQFSWEAIPERLEGRVLFLADSGSGSPYDRVNWAQPCALIVSEEAHGPSEGAQRTAHARIQIPMPGPVESLNVSVATGILLFELIRQRKHS